jgi:transposase-like protein
MLGLNVTTMDDEDAIALFRKIRWANGVFCPKCKSFNINYRGVQGKTRRYSCKECNNNFNDFSNTIFENSHIPIGTIIWIVKYRKIKTIQEMSKELNISRKSISRVINMMENCL